MLNLLQRRHKCEGGTIKQLNILNDVLLNCKTFYGVIIGCMIQKLNFSEFCLIVCKFKLSLNWGFWLNCKLINVQQLFHFPFKNIYLILTKFNLKNLLHLFIQPKWSQKNQKPSPCVTVTPKSNTLSSEHYFIDNKAHPPHCLTNNQQTNKNDGQFKPIVLYWILCPDHRQISNDGNKLDQLNENWCVFVV